MTVAAPGRTIGHDRLLRAGATAEQIAGWLACGLLRASGEAGRYLPAPHVEPVLSAMWAQAAVSRADLAAFGADDRVIRRWLRHGALQHAEETDRFVIDADALAGLCARQQARPHDAPRLRIVPCTIGQARDFVAQHHRHHGAPVSGLFAVGLARGDDLAGVAIVGRPVARGLQDGATAEVTRLCTLGEQNACSMLLAACRRAALALGYRRLVTYTLASEPGTSLRAAGWQQTAVVKGRRWGCPSRPRQPGLLADKRRWEAPTEGGP